MTEEFQFGEFIFDRSSGKLTRNGRQLKIQAQPAIALGELVAHRDRIVSREELRQVLWGTDTFVDFDQGLNYCIAQIRSVLRDDAARPVYIRTIPKQGYQFIAPVRPLASASAVEPAASHNIRKASSRMLSFSLVGVGFLLVIGAVIFLKASRPEPVPTLAVVRFDADPNLAQSSDLADRLTDDLVVQLTKESGGHYRVIGNAAVLRVNREQRDLTAISSALHCSYAVLGQVQSADGQVLILAHLIRLSDLTHIWVVRLGPTTPENLLNLEAQATRQISSEFSAKMADRPQESASFGSLSH